jgi:hypothetical protein
MGHAALLVRDTGGAGSFFSMVDITPTEHHLLLVKGVLAKPGLVTWTNNALDWSPMTDFVDEMSGSTEACAARMGVGRELVRAAWGWPAATLLCAGGFSFYGERAWLNRRVFPIDCDRAMTAPSSRALTMRAVTSTCAPGLRASRPYSSSR